jgi:hypothetical protein
MPVVLVMTPLMTMMRMVPCHGGEEGPSRSPGGVRSTGMMAVTKVVVHEMEAR